MTRFYAVLALLVSAALWAQKPAEIGLVSDNDLYSSPINDKYYTSGFELLYRHIGNSSRETVAKKITEFRIGQYIYNPQTVEAQNIDYHDRPFAGYLFAQAGLHTFFKDESVLKLMFQGGVLGPEAGAEGLQEQLHRMVGYPAVAGWEHQIQTTVGVQANVFFSKKILAQRFKEKVDFHFQGEFKGGTIWQSLSLGGMARISLKRLLLPMYDSALHGASLNHDREAYKGQRELFVFLSPNIQYQHYDATIQGSLFNNDSPVTFNLIPFRFNADLGIKYRRNHWNLSYSVHYRGKELSNNVITGYYYGSIAVGYLL